MSNFLAMPPDAESPPSLDAAPRRRRWPAAWAGGFVVLFMIGLVAGPIAYVELPREITRWHLAAAIERRLNGDLDAAIRSLDHLIAESPDNEELLIERASWRVENHQYQQALADVNRALRIAPRNPPALVLRSQVFQHLARHAEAIQDWNQLLALAEAGGGVEPAVALNGRAYARAVGRRELQPALADAEEALRREGGNSAMLDTRGFILWQLGDHTRALADLDQAVRLAEAEYEQLTKQMDAGRLGAVDPRRFELVVKQTAQSVAVIRYHRSLVHDQLGKNDLAEQDRLRVRELGFTANQDLF